MSTNINIVVKDKDTPVPDTGVITPDTGRYTNTNSNSTSMEGGMIAFTIILSSLLLLSIALIFFSRLFRKKAISTTTNSTTSKANLYSSNNKTNSITTNSITKKANLFRTLGLLLFIFTATTGIVANILKNTSFSTYAADTPLDITTSDTTITVVREDGPAYAVASAEITLNEATPAGYNLYVYGPDGNQFTSTTTTATIDTVAEKNSIISNNTYGVANTTNEPLITDAVWNPVGDTEDNAELIATTTNATNVGDKITIYYGILVDETLPAGIYTGSIEYKAYTRTYTITYDANGGTFDDDTTTTTQYIAKGSSIGTLPEESERQDYTFQGWFAAEQTTDDDEPITTETIPTGDITYYAKWVRNTYNIIFDPTDGYVLGTPTAIINTGDALGNNIPSAWRLGYGVNHMSYIFIGWFTEPGGGGAKINAATIPDKDTTYYAYYEELILQNPAAVMAAVDNNYYVIDAADARDGRYYKVDRLADGRIWLLENLALDLTMNSADGYITSENTNASATSLNALFNGSNGGENGNLARVAVTTNWDSDSYTEPLISTDYIDKTMSSITTDVYEEMDADWDIGVFYNYCAASAGSYCYDGESGTGNAAEDICPAGWRMPTGGDDDTSEYHSLYVAYDDTHDAFREAFRTPLSGSFDSSGSNFGVSADFWSSTMENASSAYIFYVDRNYYQSGTNLGRYDGLSVRCIIDESIIEYNATGGVIDDDTTSVVAKILKGNTLNGTFPSDPTRVGYNFLGWFTDKDGGTQIDNSTIPFGNTTYYAHWEEQQGLISFQDTTTIDNILQNVGDTIVVQDERDDKIYTVGRLADGNVWLLDNLNIDLADSDVQSAMDSTNTNATSESLNALFNGGGTGRYARHEVSTTWSRNVYTDPRINTSNSSEYESGFPVGTHYDYCAASAGSYCYEEGLGSDDDVEDICPAGWRMPTGGDDGEYEALYDTYENEDDQYTAFREAFRAPLSGLFTYVNGYVYSDTDGYFWSSTAGYLNRYKIALNVDTDSVYGWSSEYRFYGASVRCVLDDDESTIKYDTAGGVIDDDTTSVVAKILKGNTLNGTFPSDPTRVGYNFLGWFTDKDGGTQIDNSTIPFGNTTYYAHWEEQQGLISFQDTTTIDNILQNVGDTIVVQDERDDKIYTVGRLADGNVWLLDNLNIDLADSDVQSAMDSTNTNATSESLNALFNGGGTERYARIGVSATWWFDLDRDPMINVFHSSEYESGFPIGVYYNYCAASAGSYCISYPPEGLNSTEDICPAGWRMPTGGDDGEYEALYDTYENEDDQYAAFREAFRVSLSGLSYSSGVDGVGTLGRFWSSTLGRELDWGKRKTYSLSVGETQVLPLYLDATRYIGQSVRCIMDQ